MERIEMYNTIKENGWAKEFEEKFDKNFTQGKNKELEEFINLKSKSKVKPSTTNTKVEKKIEKEIKEEVKKEIKEEIPKKKTVVLEDINTSSEDAKKGIYVNKVAFIELISILQSESCIKGKDAERILKLI